jgi:hypothetical protein
MSESVGGEVHRPGPRHRVSRPSILRELNGPRFEINVKLAGSNPVNFRALTFRCRLTLSMAVVTWFGTLTRSILRLVTTCYSGLDSRREKRNDQRWHSTSAFILTYLSAGKVLSWGADFKISVGGYQKPDSSFGREARYSHAGSDNVDLVTSTLK